MIDDIEIVKLLLHAKANRHQKNKYGETAFQIALRLGYTNITDHLLGKNQYCNLSLCNFTLLRV